MNRHADEQRAMIELRDAVVRGDVDAIRELLERGLSMTATYQDTGLTPLLLAIGDVASIEIVRLLLSRDPDLSQRDAGGFGPVARAAMGLRPDQLSLLLDEHGADPYELCGNGASPSVNAISQFRWNDDPHARERLGQVIAIFLRHGVDPDRPDPGGAKLTPRQMAERAGVSLP
jgi:ankyrin repeat protein